MASNLFFIFIGSFVGRSNRRTFWVVSALMFVIQTTVVLTGGNEFVVGALITLPWIWIWWRRLHDINLNGAWAFLPVGMGFFAGFVEGWNRAAARDHSQVDATLTSLPANWLELALRYPDSFLTGAWNGFANTVAEEFASKPVTTSISWGMTLMLAFWPGTRGPNRFGPPPGPPGKLGRVEDQRSGAEKRRQRCMRFRIDPVR